MELNLRSFGNGSEEKSGSTVEALQEKLVGR